MLADWRCTYVDAGDQSLNPPCFSLRVMVPLLEGRVFNFFVVWSTCLEAPASRLKEPFILYSKIQNGEASGDCLVGSGDHPHISRVPDDRV